MQAITAKDLPLSLLVLIAVTAAMDAAISMIVLSGPSGGTG